MGRAHSLRSRSAIVARVELRQLAAFVAVADELHFGRAAERLGIVQPAVSQLVRRLEKELGIVLFERSSHHVAITGAGAGLLPAARRVLAAADDLAAAVPALAGGQQGELAVGTTEGMGPKLNLVLARFADEHPHASIRLEAMHTPAKVRAVRDGTLDVAFVRAPVDREGIDAAELWSEPLVALVPARHPAASTEPPLPELASLPLILAERSANPGMHDALLDACRRCGLEPRLGPPLRNVQEALATIATGAAWTLLTAGNVAEAPGVAARPIGAHTGIELIWRSTGAGPLAKSFVELALRATSAARNPVS